MLPILLVLGLFGLPADDAAAATPPLRLVACGQTITESIRVANNLLDCPNRGLIVGRAGITIDLNGHRLDASAAAVGTTGIDNGAFNGVTVKNGVLTDWDTGTFTEHAKDITISRLYIGSVGSGIVLDDVRDSTIAKNTLANAGGTGIGASLASKRLSIRGNRIYNVIGTAIHVDNGSERNTITKNHIVRANVGISIGIGAPSTISTNRIVATTGSAMFVNTDGGTVERNRIDGAGGHGIILGDSGQAQVIENNTVRGGNLSGIAIDDNKLTRVVGNTVVGNDEDGILVQDGERNTVSGNTASENGGHGINSDTDDVKISGNVANLNGFHNGLDDNLGVGILAPLGITGNGNTARENDDPQQCTDITCASGPALGFTPVLQTCNSAVPADEEVRIVNNLENCASHGLQTGATEQEIDLAGHRLDGAAAGNGINVNHPNVTVRDGTIHGFTSGTSQGTSLSVLRMNLIDNSVHGIEASGSQGGVIADNVATENGGAGFSVSNAAGYEVSRNVSVANAGRGIQLLSVTTPVVAKNVSVGNALDGLQLAPASNGQVRGNTFALNAVDGLFAGVTSIGMTITKNTLVGNTSNGIRYAVAVNCIARENRITGNGANGVALISTATNNAFEDNLVAANTLDGFDLLGTTQGSSIDRNTVARNGGHGIDSAVALRVRGNGADRNGFINGADDDAGLGINVPSGSDTSKNTAKRNDDPNECETSEVECHQA